MYSRLALFSMDVTIVLQKTSYPEIEWGKQIATMLFLVSQSFVL